jgi:hypothetical protein
MMVIVDVDVSAISMVGRVEAGVEVYARARGDLDERSSAPVALR